ncbi:hypothetical protein LX36DRAFT_591706 [Colletotrichum falcatum]|nr:hypothetical protein LX36DRAFT_591706 [Colletotrichum falcatum]
MELMELVKNETATCPFQCSWQSCNKGFKGKQNLERHYRIHTNERPYNCTTPGCGKSFIQRNDLTIHIRTHTGEKPYQCQHIDCGKRFSDSSSLARHRRTHTGQRPYMCAYDGCIKSFSQKTNMVKHQRRSHQRVVDNGGSILNDCTSDFDSGDSPSTLKHANMQWPTHYQENMAMNHTGTDQAMSQAASFNDYTQHMNGYKMQQQQQQQKYGAHRQSLSGGPAEFHGQSVHEQRTASMPQPPYFVTEQGNSGFDTMNTNMYAQVPRQQQQQVGIPYSAPNMNQSIQISHPYSFLYRTLDFSLSRPDGTNISTSRGVLYITGAGTFGASVPHIATFIESDQKLTNIITYFSRNQGFPAQRRKGPYLDGTLYVQTY